MWADGVRLAKEAKAAAGAKQPVWIAASSGCYGASLANGAEYTGDYGDATYETIRMFHQSKLECIRTLDVDAVAIETIPSLAECQVLADLLQEGFVEKGTACWISLSCRNGSELNDGTPLTRALETFRSVPSSLLPAIGLNCCDSNNLKELVTIVLDDTIAHGPVRALVIYPNSGETWDAQTSSWNEGTGCHGVDLASRLVELIRYTRQMWRGEDAPTMIVGGCCRTRPEAIAAVSSQVKNCL